MRGPHSAAPRMRDRGAPEAQARLPAPGLRRQSAAGRRASRPFASERAVRATVILQVMSSD